jgi:ribonuclease VapC
VICVDSSALLAIILNESVKDSCRDALAANSEPIISAATLAEAMIVAAGRGVGEAMAELVAVSGLQVIDVTHADAIRMAEAYRAWGKGFHSARLNFGDCFAYALAAERHCALLYVGNDFSQTDIQGVL